MWRYILIFIFTPCVFLHFLFENSSSTYGLFRSMLFSFQAFGEFPYCIIVIDFWFDSMVVRNILFIISVSFVLLILFNSQEYAVSFYFLKLLFEMQIYRKNERQRKRERSLVCWFTSQMATLPQSYRANCQELLWSLLFGFRGPSTRTNLYCLPTS